MEDALDAVRAVVGTGPVTPAWARPEAQHIRTLLRGRLVQLLLAVRGQYLADKLGSALGHYDAIAERLSLALAQASSSARLVDVLLTGLRITSPNRGLSEQIREFVAAVDAAVVARDYPTESAALRALEREKMLAIAELRLAVEERQEARAPKPSRAKRATTGESENGEPLGK